jgi:hypothetical protein
MSAEVEESALAVSTQKPTGEIKVTITKYAI